MIEEFDLVVLGNWHLASVTAAVFASHGKKVLWVNHDSSHPWKDFPQIPVMEPGLDQRIEEARAKNLLNYANGFEGWKAPLVWMAIDTPVNENDDVDCAPLYNAIHALKAHKDLELLIVNSQVPIGTCVSFEKILMRPVVYVPENLRLGYGIETFERADRTVLGAENDASIEKAKSLMAKFQTEFFTANLATAEMIKHATNTFLAMSISFANEFARIGEAFGVDANRVGEALKLDKRIGRSAYVMPGLGFAGGTLPRDLRILQHKGHEKKIPTKLIDAVLSVNEATTEIISNLIRKQLTEHKGKVLILGYTYKADTDTLRRSLSVDVARKLSEEGFQVLGFDPVMNQKNFKAISPFIEHIENWDDVPHRGISCVVLFTARSAFSQLDWQKKDWDQNTLIIDAQNFLNPQHITEKGWSYKRLWQATSHNSTRKNL